MSRNRDEESKSRLSSSDSHEDEEDEERLIARQVHHEDSEDNSDEEEGDGNRYWPPPIEETVKLTGSHSAKTISALAFNNAGTRFAAGGHDYEVRIWDFEAMDAQRPVHINNVQPSGQVVIKQLDFSLDDELILVISGSCQAVVMQRDGTTKNQPTCPKGDQYLQDMAKTKGHVQMLNDGCWSPKDRTDFMTCSNDATIRLWDLNRMSQQKTVIKTRSPASGLKAVPNVCRYSRDGLTIVAGCSDGSILFWDTRRKFLTPSMSVKGAHLKGSEMTGLDFGYTNASRLVSRSEDETCKLWDVRQPKQPIASRAGLTTLHGSSDCCFSPDDGLVLTGTSHTKSEPGQLHFLETAGLSSKQSIEVAGASVLRVRWHARINHVAYSCTDGQLRVAYERRRSMGGFLSAGAPQGGGAGGLKRRKKYTPGGGFDNTTAAAAAAATSMKRIITPHALPLFRDDAGSGQSSRAGAGGGGTKRAYRPELPARSQAAGQGGSVKPAGSTLSSYIARNIARPVADNGLSIRDRILRHADAAERDPLWITSSGHGHGVGGAGDGAVSTDDSAHATAQKRRAESDERDKQQ